MHKITSWIIAAIGGGAGRCRHTLLGGAFVGVLHAAAGGGGRANEDAIAVGGGGPGMRQPHTRGGEAVRAYEGVGGGKPWWHTSCMQED
jgi:hypothetical protein